MKKTELAGCSVFETILLQGIDVLRIGFILSKSTIQVYYKGSFNRQLGLLLRSFKIRSNKLYVTGKYPKDIFFKKYIRIFPFEGD